MSQTTDATAGPFLSPGVTDYRGAAAHIALTPDEVVRRRSLPDDTFEGFVGTEVRARRAVRAESLVLERVEDGSEALRRTVATPVWIVTPSQNPDASSPTCCPCRTPASRASQVRARRRVCGAESRISAQSPV
jgi:hypothetical protein